jgi:prepilin-type N-terminal cleavage/methylation domain-containing protein
MHPFKMIFNKSAFTLVELLMVLVAVGIIASILVPKVVVAGQNNSRRTQLQVVLQSLEGHFYDENVRGDQFLVDTVRWANLQNKLQVSQVCAFGQSACLPPSVTNVATFGGGALRLQNGMVVYGLLSDPASTTDDFYVDVNGDEGPNLGGLGGSNIANDCEDRFHFNINHVTGEVTPIECTVDFINS